MSVTKTYRWFDKLNPRTKKKVSLALTEIRRDYWNTIFITETRRSAERQAYLRSKGLSKVLVSKHQDGLAVDIAFHDDERTEQIEKDLYPRDHKKWREVADVFKKYWMDRWYDLWKRDKPHFQDNWKPLSPMTLIMWFYEKLRKDNYKATPKHKRIFKDPQSFLDRLEDLSEDEKRTEFTYLTAILVEKLGWLIEK